MFGGTLNLAQFNSIPNLLGYSYTCSGARARDGLILPILISNGVLSAIDTGVYND